MMHTYTYILIPHVNINYAPSLRFDVRAIFYVCALERVVKREHEVDVCVGEYDYVCVYYQTAIKWSSC